MITNTSDKIINIIKAKKQVKPRELVNSLDISERAVFKQLRNLVSQGILGKTGTPPKVYYFFKEEKEEEKEPVTAKNKIVEENFLIITPSGVRIEGVNGFKYWCRKYEAPRANARGIFSAFGGAKSAEAENEHSSTVLRPWSSAKADKLPFEKTIKEYATTFKKYARYKKSGLIDGMYKLKHTFSKVNIDKLYYLDFYSIERFGKTKLGWLLLYAKQSQNKLLVKELIEKIRDKVQKIIKKHDINAIGFIPPTVKRDVQLMTELERNLNFSLPVVKFQKIRTPLVVPQKTLSRLEDRIENARNTIFLNESRVFQNILLIDDAVGSGATINEAGKKIKQRSLVKGKIIGLAITGSFKGFEIISEV